MKTRGLSVTRQRGTLRPDPLALTNFLYNAKSSADFKEGGRIATKGGEGEAEKNRGQT